MEHPLIGDIDSLTLEELSSKISELHKKLGIAQRTGNAYLCDQLRMALESYNNKYQAKLQESYRKQSDNGMNFDDKINIE
jgi:hypothetical protein